MKRQNYKHGKYVMAEPNPHVDIQKYETKDKKDDGKRYKVTDSEMKVSKKNQQKLDPGPKAARQKEARDRKIVIAFKKGGSVKKKKSSRKAVRGGGCEIR
jgi:hypothetical protein